MIGANKPHLFGTYDQAVATYEAGGYTGVGVLLTGGGLIGVDMDDVKQAMSDQPAVAKWIKSALAADRGSRMRSYPHEAQCRSGDDELEDAEDRRQRLTHIRTQARRPGRQREEGNVRPVVLHHVLRCRLLEATGLVR
jgi:hypothetical protein